MIASKSPFFLFLICVLAFGCGEERQFESTIRITPSYVCEGDAEPPTVTWFHEGVKGRVDIHSAQNEELLATAGFRENNVTLNRALNQSDLPLIAKLYRRGEEIGEEPVIYSVLSGELETETFRGIVNWGEPYLKWCSVSDGCKCGEDDLGNQIERCKKAFVTATDVSWFIQDTLFGDNVLLKSIKLVSGGGPDGIRIRYPGLPEQIFSNSGDERNLLVETHPIGDFRGSFITPVEIEQNQIDSYRVGIIFMIRCQ